MTKKLTHNGYTGSVEFSKEDGILHGKLIGIRNVVSYEGEDVQSIARNFRRAVDEYVAFCKTEGKTPNKPFVEPRKHTAAKATRHRNRS